MSKQEKNPNQNLKLLYADQVKEFSHLYIFITSAAHLIWSFNLFWTLLLCVRNLWSRLYNNKGLRRRDEKDQKREKEASFWMFLWIITSCRSQKSAWNWNHSFWERHIPSALGYNLCKDCHPIHAAAAGCSSAFPSLSSKGFTCVYSAFKREEVQRRK